MTWHFHLPCSSFLAWSREVRSHPKGSWFPFWSKTATHRNCGIHTKVWLPYISQFWLFFVCNPTRSSCWHLRLQGVHTQVPPAAEKRLKVRSYKMIEQAAEMGCRAQPDECTDWPCFHGTSPFYTFSCSPSLCSSLFALHWVVDWQGLVLLNVFLSICPLLTQQVTQFILKFSATVKASCLFHALLSCGEKIKWKWKELWIKVMTV